MKVLLTEKCIFLREGILKVLQQAGHTVEVAESDNDLYDMVNNGNDAIIFDASLLGKAGEYIAGTLDANPYNTICLIATYTDPKECESRHSFNSALKKPFNREELLDAIEGGKGNEEFNDSTSSEDFRFNQAICMAPF